MKRHKQAQMQRKCFSMPVYQFISYKLLWTPRQSHRYNARTKSEGPWFDPHSNQPKYLFERIPCQAPSTYNLTIQILTSSLNTHIVLHYIERKNISIVTIKNPILFIPTCSCYKIFNDSVTAVLMMRSISIPLSIFFRFSDCFKEQKTNKSFFIIVLSN